MPLIEATFNVNRSGANKLVDITITTERTNKPTVTKIVTFKTTLGNLEGVDVTFNMFEDRKIRHVGNDVYEFEIGEKEYINFE